LLQRVLQTGQVESNREVNSPVPGRLGEVAYWRASYFPVPLPTGARGLGVTAVEITDLKRADVALREAVDRYERQVRIFNGVASTTPDFVYLFDLQGRFIYANRCLLQTWGMELSDVIGKTWRELGYEQWHHDMHMSEIAHVIETKRPIKGEVPFKAPRTGIFGVYEYIFTPVLGPDGEVEMIAGTTRDITDRKRAEEELRASEERFALCLEAAQVGTWEYDPGAARGKITALPQAPRCFSGRPLYLREVPRRGCPRGPTNRGRRGASRP